MTRPNRREFFGRSTLLGATGTLGMLGVGSGQASAQTQSDGAKPVVARRHPIEVSTYSFWQFRGKRLGIDRGMHRQGGRDGVRWRRDSPCSDAG